jgi:hypothetical protein
VSRRRGKPKDWKADKVASRPPELRDRLSAHSRGATCCDDRPRPLPWALAPDRVKTAQFVPRIVLSNSPNDLDRKLLQTYRRATPRRSNRHLGNSIDADQRSFLLAMLLWYQLPKTNRDCPTFRCAPRVGAPSCRHTDQQTISTISAARLSSHDWRSRAVPSMSKWVPLQKSIRYAARTSSAPSC